MNTKILLLVLTSLLVTECKLPDYIKVCKVSDPNINDCITKSVYALVPTLKKGIPEINVPPLEPFHIKNTALSSGSNAVHINASLKDILVRNAASFKILDMKSDIANNYFEYNVILPQLYLTGNYETDTKILAIHIQGKGPFSINVTDYYFNCKSKANRIVTNGIEHLKFDRIKLTIKIGGAKVKLENLFNGDPTLGRATNDVINDNVDIFYEAIKPAILDALEELFTDISNGIAGAFAYEELFPQ